MTHYRVVAIGTWLYDGSVPHSVEVRQIPARFSSSRFLEDENGIETIDENAPIPATADGFLYYCWPGRSGEYPSLEAAKAWVDSQPWGPVKWA